MARYVVGYLSLFEGELKQSIIEADTDVEAALDFLGIVDHPTRISLPDMDEIHGYIGDDAFICVTLIPDNK